MRCFRFIASLLVLTSIVLLSHFAPAIGIADGVYFAAPVGLRRALISGYALALILLLCVYQVLRIGIPRGGAAGAPRAVLQSALTDTGSAFAELTNRAGAGTRKNEWLKAALAAVIFTVAFAIFLSKFAGGFQFFWPFDQIWHQALVDYDALWRTPFASVPANVLYFFDIRLPVNTRSLPVLGLSKLFPPELRVPASYGLLFAGMLALFWTVGVTFGLRPAAATIFAGLVALMATIPSGLDAIFWLLPPNFFTSQFLLATWWGEAPMLTLATIVAFYWVGQYKTVVTNILVSGVFALGCYLAVFAYPAGAIYFIPLIALYCAVFFFTSDGRSEWAWKAVVCAIVAAVVLALKVPQFFVNLYGYTYGSFFLEHLRAPTATLLHDTFAVAVRGFDLRRALVFFVAIATALVMISRGPRALRRFSIAFVACEIAIVAASSVNAVFIGAPLLFSYAETAYSALWGSYFILVCMAVAVVVDRRLALLADMEPGRLVGPLRYGVPHRKAVYFLSLAIVLTAYWFWAPAPKIVAYPPPETPPVRLLAQELALAPGTPFRGRALTIFAPEGNVPFHAIALRYAQMFGSDFFVDLLPFGIPTVNESEHWTSPVTFAFLRRFFGREGDSFEKNFFWLDRYNAKIARLVGARMVVSDTELHDGTLVHRQSAGGRTLRIYRLDGVNLGQFSPTRPVKIASAAEAIGAIAAENFDPRQDVVVEEDLPSGLLPAHSVSIVTQTGPQLHVRATASGRSLAVLPFEFSHCLRLTGLGGATAARIVPVNLQQIGLLFDRRADVSIEYRYGVFDSACRGADIARAKSLRVSEVVGPPQP